MRGYLLNLFAVHYGDGMAFFLHGLFLLLNGFQHGKHANKHKKDERIYFLIETSQQTPSLLVSTNMISFQCFSSM